MKVFLDGQPYELRPNTGVIRSTIEDFPQNIRTVGQQQRRDRSGLSSFIFDDWSGGLGKKIVHDYQTNRLWDAENVDTRWSEMVLSPDFVTPTLNPSAGDLDVALSYANDLYLIRQTGVPSGAPPIAYKFTAPDTLGSHVVVIGSKADECLVCEAVIAVSNQVLVAGAGTIYSVPTLGGSLGGVGGGWVGRYKGLSLYPQFGRLGGTIHFMSYDANRLYMYVIDGAYGTAESVATVSGAVGSYLPKIVSDGVTSFAYTPGGIYDFDETPAVTIDFGDTQERNGVQVMFDNDLYFKHRFSLKHYDISEPQINSVGYDREDGLPSDKMGEITSMVSAGDWLFAAVQGATFSHILTMDRQNIWQYYARIPSAGVWVRDMFVSNAPDAIDRLWCIFGNSNFPGYYMNPIIHPALAATYSYNADPAYFHTPVMDMGMPENISTYLNTRLDANLSRPPITMAIDVYNAADRSAGLGTSPGQFLYTFYSTIDDPAGNFAIYGSPYGQTAHAMQWRLQWADGNPVFRSMITQYKVMPDIREQYDFVIDVNKTKSEQRSAEQILTEIGSMSMVKTLRTLQYGQIGTKHVDITRVPATELTEENYDFEQGREAQVQMRCVELIPSEVEGT